MELHQWGLGTGSASEGNGHGTGCPGQLAQPQVLEFKKHLNSALRYRAWILCGALQSQKLEFLIFVGPLQLGVFYKATLKKDTPVQIFNKQKVKYAYYSQK